MYILRNIIFYIYIILSMAAYITNVWSLVVGNRSDAVFCSSTGHVLCRSDLGFGSTPRALRIRHVNRYYNDNNIIVVKFVSASQSCSDDGLPDRHVLKMGQNTIRLLCYYIGGLVWFCLGRRRRTNASCSDRSLQSTQ